MDLSIAARWIAALIALIVLYKIVIKPFAKKMLELKESEPPIGVRAIAFEDDLAELPDNSGLRKKVERSLKASESIEEEKMRYETLRDRLRKIAEEDINGKTKLFENLIKEQSDRRS